MMMSLILLVLMIVVAIVHVLTTGRRKNYPRGPPGVPILGNLLDIRRADVLGPGVFNKWKAQFGDIYSLRLGSYDAVVLSNPRLLKEAFVKYGEQTSGRALNVFFLKLLCGGAGIVMNEGACWRATRRSALRAMKDFGLGRRDLDQRIQEEARVLVDIIDAQEDKAFDPATMLQSVFCNIICRFVFGKRYGFDDASFKSLLARVTVFIENCDQATPEIFVPFLTLLMPITNRKYFKSLLELGGLQKIITNNIKASKEEYDPENIASFVDFYLKSKTEDTPINKFIFAESNVLATIFDLFIGGSETSSTTLRWLLMYFVNFPEIQKKCQQEISQAIPENRLPLSSDKKHLPYTEATICEVLRISSVTNHYVTLSTIRCHASYDGDHRAGRLHHPRGRPHHT